MEVVHDLAQLEEKSGTLSWQQLTLPLSVVAAKSFAAASAELDSSIASVVVHAACYSHVSPLESCRHSHVRATHTDFWNCSRYWCACSFCARSTCDCIVLCAASTGSNSCCPLAAMVSVFGEGGGLVGERMRNTAQRSGGEGCYSARIH